MSKEKLLPAVFPYDDPITELIHIPAIHYTGISMHEMSINSNSFSNELHCLVTSSQTGVKNFES